MAVIVWLNRGFYFLLFFRAWVFFILGMEHFICLVDRDTCIHSFKYHVIIRMKQLYKGSTLGRGIGFFFDRISSRVENRSLLWKLSFVVMPRSP